MYTRINFIWWSLSDLRQISAFFGGTPVFSTNKTDRYDITEILLIVALSSINPHSINVLWSPVFVHYVLQQHCKQWTYLCWIQPVICQFKLFSICIMKLTVCICLQLEQLKSLIHNYTLYKNAGFWLVNSRDICYKLALHYEFAEFLLHVGVFA